MEFVEERINFWLVAFTAWAGGVGVLLVLLKRAHEWFYEHKLGNKRFSLPPGDLGWPLIGNMGSFVSAFRSADPDYIIDSFIKRFGKTGIYKAFMFGTPTIMLTAPEFCKQVLMDDKQFGPGWPKSTFKLMGKKAFITVSRKEHKRLRKLTAASVNGHVALSAYLDYIEKTVASTLERWCHMGEIEFLTQIRLLIFRITMYIFLGERGDTVMEALDKEFMIFNYGLRSMDINLPGFAYYKALKARKSLVEIFQHITTEKRARQEKCWTPTRKDMMEILMDSEDENDGVLSDEEIIDILIMYFTAGYEASSHLTMWTTFLLQGHPDILRKAKDEQEVIVKSRPPTQKGLTLKEVKQMQYVSKVINEAIRLVNTSSVFREAKNDIEMNGYLIPKGWKVQVRLGSVHMDPDVYSDPKKFDPSRWDGEKPKAGTYIPFGVGSRFCPGSDIAKLVVSVFLHYFLLNYRVERLNSNTKPTANYLARIIKT